MKYSRDRGGRRRSARSGTRSCARRCCATGGATRSRSPRSPTCRPAPAWAPRARSPSACSRRLAQARATVDHPGRARRGGLRDRDRRAREPVGKQDPYVAAHGGICAYTFHPTARVEVEPLELAPETLRATARPAAALLHRRGARRPRRCSADQDERSRERRRGDAREPAPHEGDRATAAASCSWTATSRRYAELMHEHWENKRRRSPGMANERIDDALHARAAQRRDRRQARRRRRRRLPARLRAATRPTRGRRWRPRARRSSRSTSSSRARTRASTHERRRCASGSSAAA